MNKVGLEVQEIMRAAKRARARDEALAEARRPVVAPSDQRGTFVVFFDEGRQRRPAVAQGVDYDPFSWR